MVDLERSCSMANLDTPTIASGPFPLPTTKEWGEGQGEGPPNNVEAAETIPSPQPLPSSPRSSLAGRGSGCIPNNGGSMHAPFFWKPGGAS